MFKTPPNVTSTSKPLSRRLAPGPKGYLFFDLKQAQQDSLQYLMRMWHEYGDLVNLRFMPGFSLYLASHPDYAEHILSTHQERYGRPNIFTKPMSLMVGQGIIVSEGEFWKKQRRLMQPAFHQKQIEDFCNLMVQCTESIMHEWERKPEGEVIDIAVEMMRLTLKIVGLALFSVDISDDSNELGQAFRTSLEYIFYKMSHPISTPVWLPTTRNRRFIDAKQTLDKFVLEIIHSRRNSPTQAQDLLSMLLGACDEITGETMSERQLQDEIINLLAAGYETVATTLAWTWYLLGTHPDIAANLYNEVQSVLGVSPITFEKIPQLQYTRRCFDEALRLCPPGFGQPRVALEDDEIAGYFIPKGTNITIAYYFIARHPKFWENPEKFDPERFLPEKVNQRPKFAYFPFGGGQRICIGKSFAVMEGVVILAAILQRFQVELVSKQKIAIDANFTLRPKYGIKVRIRNRNF